MGGIADSPRRVAAAPGMLIRDWGEDVSVVFSAATASTHLVSADAAAVLAAAADRPGGADAAALAAPEELVDALVLAGLLRRVE